MNWWAIDVRPDASRRERVGAWLVERTGQAVEEREDGTLVTFAEDERAADALVAALLAAEPLPVETSRRPLDTVDWTTRWRDGLGARRLGRLTVVPSWIESAGDAGGPTVVLDPETAFGSGEHGSTRAALTLLERHVQAGRSGARPGQRKRHPRDRRRQARRREGGRHRERSGGQPGRPAERRAE